MGACDSCGSTNAAGVLYCAKCGKPLAATVSPLAQALQDEALVRDIEQRQRVRRLRISHAIVGAVTFFVINLLLGIPLSFTPNQLILNAIFSTVFGMPIGYLISRQRGGAFHGALISGGTFAALRLVLGLSSLDHVSFGSLLFSAILCGLPGLIPGALIGMHVESDE